MSIYTRQYKLATLAKSCKFPLQLAKSRAVALKVFNLPMPYPLQLVAILARGKGCIATENIGEMALMTEA